MAECFVGVRDPLSRRGRRPRGWLVGAAAVFVASAAPLGAQTTGVVTGRVTEAGSNEGMPGVTISVIGTALGTLTRQDGTYRLVLEAGRHELRASFIGYRALRDTVQVTAGQTTTQDFSMEKAAIDLDRVVVVGSRRTDRTVLESPVPVDVLSQEDIRQTGLTETNQIIQMLAPSFNFPRATIGDGTDHVRPSTLRGLGPDQVLVLINGKRRHTSALVNINGTIGRGSTGVDLNAIPASAIDRIEVLRDGAAAQYGSDAIAGVINIILKSDQAEVLSAQFGQTVEGDGQVYQADFNAGGPVAQDGFIHWTAEFRKRGLTNRSIGDARPQFFADTTPAVARDTIQTHRQGDPNVLDVSSFFNAQIPRASGMQLYSFGGASYRHGKAAGFWRRPNDDRTVRFGVVGSDTTFIHPNGFLPRIWTDIWDASLSAGARGQASGWGWDLSAVYGWNKFDFSVHNSNNASMGIRTPTDFEAGGFSFGQLIANLDLVRTLGMWGFREPLNLGVGGELRQEDYSIHAGEAASYIDGGVPVLNGPRAGARTAPGAQVFPGFRPSDELHNRRRSAAAYVDLEGSPMTALTISAAGRSEYYQDFGSTTNGKLALRVEPVKGYAVRAAAQTGFRAPSLAQQNFSSTATNFIGGVPFEIRTFPVADPVAQVLGARPLDPEKSVNLSAGLTLAPVQNLSLTTDFYQIKIEDRIVLSGNFIDPSGVTTIRDLLASRGFTGVAGGRYFTNAIDTRTNGVDVVLNYGIQLWRESVLRITGGYNHNRTKLTHVDTTPPELGLLGTVLFDRIERARIQRGQPRDNILLTTNYTIGRWAVNLSNHRYGEVTSFGSATTDTLDQTFSAKWITDLDLSYRTGGLRLAVGANNLFDVYPDRNNNPDTLSTTFGGNSNFGIFPYSGISPFGFNGAFYYTKLTYDFAAGNPFRNPFRRSAAAPKRETTGDAAPAAPAATGAAQSANGPAVEATDTR